MAAAAPPIVQHDTEDTTRDDVALELFIHRSSGPLQLGDKAALAKACFRDADVFLRVQADIKSGKLDTAEPVGIQLATVRAPNLKKTHPHNLVSQVHGDLKRVREINDWLKLNPLATAYDELGWDLPTTALARVLFPEYVEKETAKRN